MGWPVCNYPRYLYPLEENLEHNKQQDDKCLAEVEDTIEKQLKAGCPAAGIIAEPVQAEGGDHHGSAYWFQERSGHETWCYLQRWKGGWRNLRERNGWLNENPTIMIDLIIQSPHSHKLNLGNCLPRNWPQRSPSKLINKKANHPVRKKPFASFASMSYNIWPITG